MPDWIFCDCPHCGNTLRLDPNMSEKASPCPACKRLVTLAEAIASEPPAAALPSNAAGQPPTISSRKDRRRHKSASPAPKAAKPAEISKALSSEPDDHTVDLLPDRGDDRPSSRAAAYFADKTPTAPSEPVDFEKVRKVEWTEDEEISLGRGFAEEFDSTDAVDDSSEEQEFDEDGNPIPKKRAKGRKRRFGLWWDNLDWDTEEPRSPSRERATKRLIQAGIVVLTLGTLILGVLMFTSRGRTGGGDGTETDPRKRLVLTLPGDDKPALPKEEANWALRDALATRPKQIIDTLRPTVERFLSTPKWRDRLQVCRDPERVLPLMEKYYSLHPDEPYRFLHVGMDGNISYRDNLMVINAVMKDYSQKQIAIAYENGHFLIDWESFVGYGDLDPPQMKDLRPAKPFLMRVGISPSLPPYFNYAFTDETTLDCYVLNFPDDSYAFGYVEKMSPTANRVAELLGPNPATLVTLKLRYPEGAVVGDQVWIEEVLAEGWVLVETPGVPKP